MRPLPWLFAVAPPLATMVGGCPAQAPASAARPPAGTSSSDAAVTSAVVPHEPPASTEGPTSSASSGTAPTPPPPSTTATVPVATAEKPLKGRCLDVRTLEASGEAHSCYPYRCVVDRCLDGCSVAETHCAPFAGPGMDPAKFGWPLECILGRCVPMNPSKVHPKGPP